MEALECHLIKGIHHIAIGVPELDQAVTFYCQAFGFTEVQRTTIASAPKADQAVGLEGMDADMAMLKAPNCYVELWQYKSPQGVNKISQPNDLGYPHMALEVEDIDAEHARLSALGMEFVGPPVNFGESSAVYGRDPFGNVIEIYEIRNAATAQLSDVGVMP